MVIVVGYIQKPSRNVALEALRGIASVAVLLWHCQCAGLMFPGNIGFFNPEFSHTINPLYIFMNGPAAVLLFFVLSGYVLTRAYFISGNTDLLMLGAIKRWPRLMGPVLCSILCSYALFRCGLYAYEAAAHITGSDWLNEFGFAGPQPLISFEGAFMQGAFWVFFSGERFYNSALWTMKAEFFGSLMVFSAAPFLYFKKYKSIIFVFLFFIFLHLPPMLLAIPAGAVLAACLPQKPGLRRREAWGMLLFGLLLLPRLEGFGPFSDFKIYPSIFGAMMLISAVELYAPFQQNLSGKFWQYLGAFSFPIYLVHMLVIGSVASWVCVYFSKMPALITTLVVTPIAAYPMWVFDTWWVKSVNRLTAFCFAKFKDGQALPQQILPAPASLQQAA